MKVAIDTNILVYFAGIQRAAADRAKISHAQSLLPLLGRRAELVVPAQALGETFAVLVRSGVERPDALSHIRKLARQVESAATESATMMTALELAVAHRIQIWDAVILTAAAESGCALLLSEDMQHGFSWRGVAILNPFLDPVDDRLASLLAD